MKDWYYFKKDYAQYLDHRSPGAGSRMMMTFVDDGVGAANVEWKPHHLEVVQ